MLREVAEPHISLICDAKEAGGDTYYRLSERKVHTQTPAVQVRTRVDAQVLMHHRLSVKVMPHPPALQMTDYHAGRGRHSDIPGEWDPYTDSNLEGGLFEHPTLEPQARQYTRSIDLLA